MKRQTNDAALKVSIASEYEAGHETYSTLARKYSIPRPTIVSWVRKARLFKSLPNTTPMIQEGFLNITPRLQETQQSIKPDEITLQINGFEIKTDLQTITKLISGSKHVLNH